MDDIRIFLRDGGQSSEDIVMSELNIAEIPYEDGAIGPKSCDTVRSAFQKSDRLYPD